MIVLGASERGFSWTVIGACSVAVERSVEGKEHTNYLRGLVSLFGFLGSVPKERVRHSYKHLPYFCDPSRMKRDKEIFQLQQEIFTYGEVQLYYIPKDTNGRVASRYDNRSVSLYQFTYPFQEGHSAYVGRDKGKDAAPDINKK